jgi:hypothetical protein
MLAARTQKPMVVRGEFLCRASRSALGLQRNGL